MKMTISTRVPRRWASETIDASPAQVKEAREKKAALQAQAKAKGKTIWDIVPMGTRVFAGCSGTLSELYEAGCEPHIGGRKNQENQGG